MGRKSPIRLYAPQNYEALLRSHLSDFDIKLSFEIDFVPLYSKDPVQILDDKYLTVTSFPLQHRIPAYGFLFREKPAERNIIVECIGKYQIPLVRIAAIKKGEDFITPDGTLIRNEEITLAPPDQLSYAYCSDTRYFKKLASFIKGVTLLYHEATFDKSKAALAEMTGHSTTLDAAKTALNADAGTLIIGHFSARYREVGILVNEARTIFPNTVAAIDGKTFDVGNMGQE
jgi:ribonuclease Z